MGPTTTNPWLIALINMTIVFAVLAALGGIMNLIKIVDPTQKKSAKPAVAPAAAPRAAAPVAKKNDAEVMAVIAAAVAAYGYSSSQIACVSRLSAAGWSQNARIEAISARKECF
ncbi:hypothetical protein SDC9_119397 [bioreactor metagenome]|uniref:Oxaloacetate decarboxylase gamma chain n=1 Tax=bioreactor metagenome TaxID=1076179 RepID=A0A645C601_9ZZZZ